MEVALDIDRITDLFRGDLELAEQLGTAEDVWIPLLALGEIKAGFEGDTQSGAFRTVPGRPLLNDGVLAEITWPYSPELADVLVCPGPEQ